VRILKLDAHERLTRAMDVVEAGRLLNTAVGEPSGLAVDPDFARNRFVYMATLPEEGSRRLLRIVRMREAGDTFGEPASLYEATVVGDARVTATNGATRLPVTGGPRIAFGPDGLLYVALPDGFTFDREPLASRPHPSMVRLRSDGLLPDSTPLTEVRAHPQAFTWNPADGALWLAFVERDRTTLEASAGARKAGTRSTSAATTSFERLAMPTRLRTQQTGPALVIGSTTGLRAHPLTRSLLLTARSTGTVRLTVPVTVEGGADRFGDFVSGADGTWYALTSNGDQRGDVVVRLRRTSTRPDSVLLLRDDAAPLRRRQ
jgi:hypothetical protein